MKGAVSRSEELSIIGDIQGTVILAFPGNSITRDFQDRERQRS